MINEYEQLVERRYNPQDHTPQGQLMAAIERAIYTSVQ
jgi:hypothetical protein